MKLAYHQSIFDAAPDGIVIVNDKGIIIDVNPRMSELFGHARAEMLGQSVDMLVPLEARDAHPQKRQSYFNSSDKQRLHVIFKGRRKDGSTFSADINLVPIETEDGMLTAAIIRDTTQREMEREEHSRLAAIVESATDAIIGKRLDGTIQSWNPSAEHLFGYRPEEIIGEPISILIPANLRDEEDRIMSRIKRGERVEPYESVRQHKNGRLINVWLTISPVRDMRGRIVGASKIIADLTARKRTEKLFRNLLDSAPDATVVVDTRGKIVFINSQTEKMFGYTAHELLERPVELLIPERFQPNHTNHRDNYFHNPRVRPMGDGLELFGRRKDGSEFPIEISLGPIESDEGMLVASAVRDISARKDIEQQPNLERNYANAMLDVLPGIFYHYDSDMRLVRWNKNHETVTGYTAEELRGKFALSFIPLDEQPVLIDKIAEVFEKGTATPMQTSLIVKDGSTIPYLLTGVRFGSEDKPGILGVGIDISDIKKAEQTIRDSLQEKEILLKEIHHRVKNNLAVISSLFYLESKHLTDGAMIKVMQESQDRIRSMALVHESLYSTDVGTVEFSEYANALAGQLVDSYSAGGRIKLTTHLESARLGIDIAVPCGLILNEIVTNAVKHAFPNERAGAINLCLHWKENNEYVIEVQDDGVGFPSEFVQNSKYRKAPSLGLRLIHALTRQVDGVYEFLPGHPGTIARLTLRLERESE